MTCSTLHLKGTIEQHTISLMKFNRYKETLFNILLEDESLDGLNILVEVLSKSGQSKQAIYELFLNLHQEIQVDERTKENYQLEDHLADFMDGFTSWGGSSFRLLPDEPDCV